MHNAEEIIELEKKWLKYQIKQKIKFLSLFSLLMIICLYPIYQFYIKNENNATTLATKTIPVAKNIEQNKTIIKEKVKKYTPVTLVENNNTQLTTKDSENSKIMIKLTNEPIQNTDNNETNIKKTVILDNKKEIQKSYYFKLQPIDQGNELFSSNGILIFNSPYVHSMKPINKTPMLPIKSVEMKNENTSIAIDMKEIDTITYLKEKYYATSSIVFALMLCEEYYDNKNYKESLKWALTANDIDSENTKTWFWFAKSKVKLNQKDDAIKALKAYLANNSSKRLSTLLNKIELGDTND